MGGTRLIDRVRGARHTVGELAERRLCRRLLRDEQRQSDHQTEGETLIQSQREQRTHDRGSRYPAELKTRIAARRRRDECCDKNRPS